MQIRHDLAILESASSEFVAKIHAGLISTMDRVSARFTFTTRRITLANSCADAMAIQMDTISIVNRLASKRFTARSLVEKAYAQDKLSAMDPQTTYCVGFASQCLKTPRLPGKSNGVAL